MPRHCSTGRGARAIRTPRRPATARCATWPTPSWCMSSSTSCATTRRSFPCCRYWPMPATCSASSRTRSSSRWASACASTRPSSRRVSSRSVTRPSSSSPTEARRCSTRASSSLGRASCCCAHRPTPARPRSPPRCLTSSPTSARSSAAWRVASTSRSLRPSTTWASRSRGCTTTPSHAPGSAACAAPPPPTAWRRWRRSYAWGWRRSRRPPVDWARARCARDACRSSVRPRCSSPTWRRAHGSRGRWTLSTPCSSSMSPPWVPTRVGARPWRLPLSPGTWCKLCWPGRTRWSG
mmetsp:Transcript_56923/g.136794  ORF Transcript_56923/g.136794 Transcript_56923/m.136794 type:complete len:294 (+) Transcript_56923:694-1575(+)